MRNTKFKKAFTLIELLIVVAIIAILAAIAVPNFLEAQTRSKVSRAKADMRSLATALEAYAVDNNAYPQGNSFGTGSARITDTAAPIQKWRILERLSTPVAYMSSSLLPDPFASRFRSGNVNPTNGSWPTDPGNPPEVPANEAQDNKWYKYNATVRDSQTNVAALVEAGTKANGFWILNSCGPDTVRTQLAGSGLLGSSATPAAVANNVYDPTNGTVSRGSVFRVGGASTGPSDVFFRTIQGMQ